MDGDRQRIEPGWTVVGSDGDKIGKVVELRDDVVVVEHGMLEKQHLYVPIDEVAGTESDSVTLKIPADHVTEQGWQFSPSSSYHHGELAAPEVPDTTMIQTAGYSAGTLSAPEAQGFARDTDGEDEVLANRMLDPEAEESIDEASSD